MRVRGCLVAAPGDGDARYVKPFRTIEDVHVHAAMLAYLLREARRLAWPRNWVERAFAAVLALSAIAQREANAAATHIALAGALAAAAGLVDEADIFWEAAAVDPAGKRWKRDRGSLSVAGSARKQRVERAWERMAAEPSTRT